MVIENNSIDIYPSIRLSNDYSLPYQRTHMNLNMRLVIDELVGFIDNIFAVDVYVDIFKTMPSGQTVT